MEGTVENHVVDARRERQSSAATSATPQEGGRENSAVCEGLEKPHFSPGAPSDSVLTDSGVSEMTNTESDYSDSLEQDDEDVKSSPDGGQPSSIPSSSKNSKVNDFEDSGDGSWFDDQDSADFFIDSNLSHDSGIVEFDPNTEDFTNWDDVRSFFEGLIERQNTELDKISNFAYNPEGQDTYTLCRSVSSDDAEKKQKLGFSLFEDDVLLDTENLVGPFPSCERHVMHGTVPLRAPKVIKYKYEMHDESWGYSSHEPYFDVLTGQRILSTIYEFEVSSDEDTDSVKVTEESWHEASSERHGEAGSIIEEEEEEAAADEIICGEEAKQSDEMPMQRGDASGGNSSSAANTSSGDIASHDYIILSGHVSAAATPSPWEGREEGSEGVRENSVNNPVDRDEMEAQGSNVMTDGHEDSTTPVPKTPRSFSDKKLENYGLEFDNLVNLETTTETSKQAVGTTDSAITGHTFGVLEDLRPTSDVEERKEEKIDRGATERETDESDTERGTDDGERNNLSIEGKHKASFRCLSSCDSPSSPRESLLRDDPADLCLEAKPNSPPAAGPERGGEGAAADAAPQSLEGIDTSEGVHHEVSSREASGKGKGNVIPQLNEATRDISSLAEAYKDSNGYLVNPVLRRPADAPANHFSGMQKEFDTRTENSKGASEAIPGLETLTGPSSDAERDLKEEETLLAATDTVTQESPEDLTTCEVTSSVPSGEDNIIDHQKHSEEINNVETDEKEPIKLVDDDEGIDAAFLSLTKTPKPPQRPHRRTLHHNAPEACFPSGVSPPQVTTKTDVRVTDDIQVPEACVAASSACVDDLMSSVGAPLASEASSHEGSGGCGEPGSSEGQSNTHTRASDGEERMMEEDMKEQLPEDSAVPPIQKKEVKVGKEREVEECVQTTRTLQPLQQQEEHVATHHTTTATTTTVSEADTEMTLSSRDREEVAVENKQSPHVDDQGKSTQTLPFTLPPTSINTFHSDSTKALTVAHTVNTMANTLSITASSPQKPERSSRNELRKQRTSHADVFDSEGSERNGCCSAAPPARPTRRKHNVRLRPRKTKDIVEEQEWKNETQSEDLVKHKTTAAVTDEAQTIEGRVSGAETREQEKLESDNQEAEEAEADGNENTDRRSNARVTGSEGKQARSDSGLETAEKMHQDDRLNGDSAEGERQQGSDSGSARAEEVAAGEGSSRTTISIQEEPSTCATLPANTNSLDDAAADLPEKRRALELGSDVESHTVGILGVIGQHKPKVIENSELVCNQLQSEAVEAGKEEQQEAGDDPPPCRLTSPPSDTDPPATVTVVNKTEETTGEELPLALYAKWDHYTRPDSKEHIETLVEEAEVKATSPAAVNEVHVAPPRRRRKVSSSRSLHQEDAVIESDISQNLTRPIPPVRRKRQFNSLPRPPKTKLFPCDVSPSLSTSALAFASTTEIHTATSSPRPVSFPAASVAETLLPPTFTPLRPASSVLPASSTPVSSPEESPAFPATPIRLTSTPTTLTLKSPHAVIPSSPIRPTTAPPVPPTYTLMSPSEKSPAIPPTPLRPVTNPTAAASAPASPPYTSPEANLVRSKRAARAKPKIKMDVEAACSRRMSAGSTQEERKRRTLKKALRRTGSLKEMLYTQLQQRLDKNSREADDGLKIKYFPKIFNRKQKLYDMSCPSDHPSEIPAPAPPQQHLTSESTETFATLLSSYFPPDMEDQSKSGDETRSRYIAFEHSPFDPPVDVNTEKKPLPVATKPTHQEHVTVTANEVETKVILQKSLASIKESFASAEEGITEESCLHDENSASAKESFAAAEEGSTEEGCLHDESSSSAKDSPLNDNTSNKQSSQGASDHENTALNLVTLETTPKENYENRDERCWQHLQKDPEKTEKFNDTAESFPETIVEEKEETATPDDRHNGEATDPDTDHSEDWKTTHRDHNLSSSGEHDRTAPSSPPPPPTDEEEHDESREQQGERQTRPVWEPPHVSLRTWAERQGIKSLILPPLRLRSTPSPDLEALDYYCDSDSSEGRDTPSPGPPVDSEKEGRQGLLQKQKKEEDRTQKDRCVEVYPETVRQRQRNMMAANNKVDIQNWESSNNNNNNDSQTSPAKSKKFLPSVKALRNQFEPGKTPNGKSEVNGNVTTNGTNGHTLSRKSSSSSVASSTPEKTTATLTLHTSSPIVDSMGSPGTPEEEQASNEPVEPIFNQFRKVDQELRELMSKGHSTTGWDPRPLLKRLYYIPEAPKLQSQGTTYVNIEGYLEKLPSGRKKATFWNAWKRRYFMAKNGILYYYQNAQTDKPSMKMTLMGGKVECMEPNMVGVDDGKGHYVVVRCTTRQEAERWRRALETHTVEDFASQYVQPWPVPTNPTLLRDTLIVDIGSASVRAGVLASQATLPQVFIPSVVASGRDGRGQVWGMDALAPDVRANSSLAFPIRPTHKISKYSVDLSAVSSLLQKTFADLKVDPKNYHVQLSVPRVLNTNTQAELLRVLFEKFGVRSVNLTHQSILALYAYNATSGIVVDIGERMDIVPVIDGYIVDGGVSRVPYGGYRILDHLRQFLYMRNVSLINEVESYVIRQVLENICYCAHHYNTEKARCTKNPDNFEKSVSLAEYFGTKDCSYESISLDFGRFQATEGLFNPDAWGLDHPGLHKLVHKAIMECSMDIRKEMSRSIFLAGGVTQLPGLMDRLTTELDNLTPPAIRPKVHASPYRYHAAYIGACVLAESPAFTQSRITQEDWNKHGNSTLRKWSL